MNDKKEMSVGKFVELGLLQEINRRFLHPMGLALSVIIEEDGSAKFADIRDYRSDPDGMAFSEGVMTKKKTDTVTKMFEKKRAVRKKTLGWHIQPPVTEKHK